VAPCCVPVKQSERENVFVKKYFATYAATLLSLLIVDLIWLGVVAKPIYSEGIGHLMAEQPNLWAAAAFYLLYAAGLIYFAIAPPSRALAWKDTLLTAAIFGFVAYATYDLSNLATLRNWPPHLAIIDIAWGTVLSSIAAAAGKASFNWASAH
jgi:uncharacterized membrane protein